MWKQNKIASESYTARLNTYKKNIKWVISDSRNKHLVTTC